MENKIDVNNFKEIWLVNLKGNIDFNTKIDINKTYVVGNYYGISSIPLTYVYDTYESLKNREEPIGTTTLLNISEILEVYK